MLKITLLCVGTLKPSPLLDLYKEYEKRMQWRVDLKECRDNKALEKAIKTDYPVIILDEKGENIKSTAFANAIQKYMNIGQSSLQIVIGGADGIPAEIKKYADKTIAFGKQTWPHMFVRVMIMEQLYRAEQILNGHPYHRD